MTDAGSSRERFAAAVDAIEGGYEFLLAYAAQGRHTDRNAAQSPRPRLEAMAGALAVLPDLARAVAAEGDDAAPADGGALFAAFERDADIAAAAVRLVLRQADIGSGLIDNLNASIHLRAVLTDIFLLDGLFGSKA